MRYEYLKKMSQKELFSEYKNADHAIKVLLDINHNLYNEKFNRSITIAIAALEQCNKDIENELSYRGVFL